MPDLDSKYRSPLEAQLEAGEDLRGEGKLLGGLGGGEAQRLGLEALAEWFRAIDT